MNSTQSSNKFFLVQIGPRGYSDLNKFGKYENPNWRKSRKDQAHGDVAKGDLIVFYTTTHVEDAPGLVKYVYSVETTKNDHNVFLLKKLKEIEEALHLYVIREMVENKKLSPAFKNAGRYAFNICEISSDDYKIITKGKEIR